MGDAGPQIHVGGNVLGQLVVGDHNVTVWAEQSVVTVLAPGDRPNPQRRAAIGLPPRRGTAPIGREQELAALLDAVTTDRLVQVYGLPGTGKSTLIRHAAGQLADDTPGVVFLSAAGRDVADVLQDVFETCYDTAGYRPGPVELRHLMAGVHVRLFVDDLEAPDDQRTVLLDSAPDATVVFTSAQRALWNDGHAVALTGLDQEPGLALLAHLLDRPLRADELAAAAELWRASDGSPLQLLRAVAGARRDVDGTVALPRAAELGELLPRIFAMLSPAARETVAVLTIAGVGGDLLPWLISDAASATGALTELADLGVVITAGRGYQLAPGVLVPPDLGMGAPQLAWTVQRLQEWARMPGLSPQAVADHVGLITSVIVATMAAGQAQLGGQLAMVTAPLAACSLRLGAWEQILRHGIEAARLAGDRRTVAYLTHEDGVHKLITGKRVAAVAAVGAAIALWHELGDTAHIALAQHVQGIAAPATSAVHTGLTHVAVTHQVAMGAKAGAISAKAGLGAKAGIGIGAKLAIAGAATVVVAGAAVGVTVLTAPKHQPPTPAISAPQLTGVQLVSALVPVTELPADYTDWQANNSGATLSTAQPTVQFADMTCTQLFGGGYTDGAVVSPSGLGASAAAGAVAIKNAALAGSDSEYEINQQIIQFPTATAASTYFHDIRTVLATCDDWSTGKPVGASVDVAPVDGHPAISGRHAPPIANPGGGNNPIETDLTFFTLDGPDVYLIGYGQIAGQDPSSGMPGNQTTLSLVTKLIGNVTAVSAGHSITRTVPPTTTTTVTTTATSVHPVLDTGPAGVVESYVAAINNHDYQTAWAIGGQLAGGSYDQFVAGFATTDHDVLSNVSAQGNNVVADLTAYQTDGTQQTFHGTYTVTNGAITHASVQRTG
jgi:RecA/RadA recombinase